MKVIAIAANDLRRTLRDRTAFFFMMAFPIVIIVVIGSATAGFDNESYPVGVVDRASGTLGVELTRELDRFDAIEVERFVDEESLRKAIRRGAVAAGIVVPPGYDTRVRRVDAEVRFLFDQTRGFPVQIRAAAASVVAGQGGVLQAARFASERTGRPFDERLGRARELDAETHGVGVRAEVVGREQQETELAPGFGYQAPSNLLLFVFITSLAASAALIETRRLGVLRRMLGTPTGAATLVAGETLGRFVVSLGQALFIFLVGTFVFGVDWGRPLGALLVILLFVLVGTSVGVLAGTTFRTAEQAGAIGPPIGIAMGMLGGCMWPRSIVPEVMQRVGDLTPHGWAMDAWIKLIGQDAGLGDIATELLVLTGFVVVLFPLGVWRLRRVLAAG